MMWNPAAPGKSPGDDDLEIFYRGENDDEVGQLLS